MSDFTRPAAPRSRRGSFDLRAPQNISLDLARSSTHLRSNSQLASAGSEAREMILQMPVGVSEDAQIRLSTGTKIHHQRCRESTSEIEKIFNEEKNKSLPPSPRLSQSSLFFDKSPAESLLNLNRNSSFARKFGGAEFHAHHAENWILDTDDKNYDFKFNVSVVGAKGTGKRTMVFKECENHDTNSYLPENHRSAYKSSINPFGWGNKLVRIEFWIANTATSSEDIRGHTARILSSSAATIFVFDVNSRKSFFELKHWVQEMNKNPHYNNRSVKYMAPKSILLANCLDRKKMRIIGTAEAQKFADENGMLYHECFSNDWKTFKKVYFSLVHMIINPLLDSVSGEPVSLMHVKAMTAGFVRTRTAISYDDKLAYTSMLEASEQNDELTTAVDWL